MAEVSESKNGGPGANAIESVRASRALRYSAASRLVQLVDSVDPELVSNIMNKLDMDSLDCLPQWCHMDDASLREFQRLAGALFLAPMLKKCIDGPRLIAWRNVMGGALFDLTIDASLPPEIENSSCLPETLPDADESLLFANGASILLSTLSEHPAQPLMEYRFAEHHGLVNKELALQVHHLALTELSMLIGLQENASVESDEPNTLQSGIES